MFGVIDLGSNNVRLSVYKVTDNAMMRMFDKKEMAGLVNFVDSTGNLTYRGINRAIWAINEMKTITDNVPLKALYPFATASLRNINNTEAAVDAIRAATGLEVQVISGEEEAHYGFVGATLLLRATHGLLVDIGGGSTELVFFRNNRIDVATSIPVGSLNMWNGYVRALLPTEAELRTIEKVVEWHLDKLRVPEKVYEPICGVGGTIRAANKLNTSIYDTPATNMEFEAHHIGKIIELISDEEKKRILQVVPERINTILPGMTILKTVAERYHSETVVVSSYGVREGYLYSRLVEQGDIIG